MKKHFGTLLTATILSLVLGIFSTPLQAREKQPLGVNAIQINGPTISKESLREGYLQPYAFYAFAPGNVYDFINEVRCEMTSAAVTDDNGRGYTLQDPLALLDKENFIQVVAKGVNRDYIKSVEAAPLRPQGKGPAFAVRVTENVVLDTFFVGVTASYTAKQDTVLDVLDGTYRPGQLTVRKGGKLSFQLHLTVDYHRLSRLSFTPDYASSRVKLTAHRAFGVSGETMYADFDQGADYTWQSAAGIICAQVNVGDGTLRSAPKLYTSWTDRSLKEMVKGKTAFIRSFSPATVNGSVTLLLENPFLTYDGEEVIPAKTVYIYREAADGSLQDVTKTFQITKNHRGRSAFSAKVSALGTYILTNAAL